MSEAERVPRGGRPGALKQTKGHQEETIRDHWAELVLGAGDSDDMPSELTDIAEALQKHNPEMTVTNTQVQESWRRFCTKNPQLLAPDETTAPAAAESSRERPCHRYLWLHKNAGRARCSKGARMLPKKCCACDSSVFLQESAWLSFRYSTARSK